MAKKDLERNKSLCMDFTNMTFENFKANVEFKLYKIGTSTKTLARMFNVSLEHLNLILLGRSRSKEDLAIIKAIIFYLF